MFFSYRNQSTDFHRRSVDWFLFDGNINHKWVKKQVVYKQHSSVFLQKRYLVTLIKEICKTDCSLGHVNKAYGSIENRPTNSLNATVAII